MTYMHSRSPLSSSPFYLFLPLTLPPVFCHSTSSFTHSPGISNKEHWKSARCKGTNNGSRFRYHPILITKKRQCKTSNIFPFVLCCDDYGTPTLPFPSSFPPSPHSLLPSSSLSLLLSFLSILSLPSPPFHISPLSPLLTPSPIHFLLKPLCQPR